MLGSCVVLVSNSRLNFEQSSSPEHDLSLFRNKRAVFDELLLFLRNEGPAVAICDSTKFGSLSVRPLDVTEQAGVVRKPTPLTWAHNSVEFSDGQSGYYKNSESPMNAAISRLFVACITV